MKSSAVIGIWIDLNEAILATGTEIIDIVASEFTIGHTKGGSGSSTPYGTQDAVSESKVLAKRKQSLKIYFKEIIDRIDHFDNVFLLGPGQVKNQLAEEIQNSHSMRNASITAKTADKITHNQFRALIREFQATL